MMSKYDMFHTVESDSDSYKEERQRREQLQAQQERNKYRNERLFLTGIFGSIALWVSIGVSWAAVAGLNAHLYVLAVSLAWTFGAMFCLLVVIIPLLIHWALINDLFEE